MYDSILVATDGSETAETAVTHGLELAKRFDAALYGITVVDVRTAYDTGIVDPDEVEQHLREQAADWLADLEAAAADADLAVETTIRTGVPHEEILEYAAETDIDVIVVGARGRSSFRGALLGSTVDRVVRVADRTVLVVGDASGSSSGAN
ncbi:universal stress protein [Natrinema caseinilyticum]|uniref:universal stress protein n=1 Tax=Natrinema caseinilyticum TaxID=2961570 RepID=UPI0020C405A2|nr:universal stress protein [Natrinema caseinilyticum]